MPVTVGPDDDANDDASDDDDEVTSPIFLTALNPWDVHMDNAHV